MQAAAQQNGSEAAQGPDAGALPPEWAKALRLQRDGTTYRGVIRSVNKVWVLQYTLSLGWAVYVHTGRRGCWRNVPCWAEAGGCSAVLARYESYTMLQPSLAGAMGVVGCHA